MSKDIKKTAAKTAKAKADKPEKVEKAQVQAKAAPKKAAKTAKAAKPAVGPIDPRAYDIILSPVITEKATLASERNQVVFRVAKDATKPQILAAVQSLFNVQVANVNTLNIKGKKKFFRGRPGHRGDVKKAVVTLVDGQSIDVTTGL
jgi:large subunit ribosomal protein L23